MQDSDRQVDGEEFLRILHDYLLQHGTCYAIYDRVRLPTGFFAEKSLSQLLLPLNPSCIHFLHAKFHDIDTGTQFDGF